MKRFVALLMIIAALLTACADARLGKNAAGAVNENDSKVIENPQDVTAKMLKALCVDGGDGLSTGISLHEYPAWSLENLAYRYDQSAPKTAEIDLLDMHFTGSYVTSSILINASTYSTSLSHKYECVSEDGAAIEFWLDSKTGKLTQFGRIKTLSADGSVDEEKCRAAAEKIASEILGDKQNEYVVETRSDGTYYYSYCAYRMIDGCKSADRIIISVDREEKPAALIMSSLGSFDGISSLPFGKEEAETVIAEKIASVSPEIYGYKSYEIKDATPVVLEDGSVGCVYSVDVKTEYDEYDEEAGETFTIIGGDAINILVVLGQ